jgi:hypothetical protein
MGTKANDADFAEIGRLSLEQLFKIQGDVETPMVVFEKNGIIQIQRPLFEVEDIEKLHESILATLVDLIQKFKLHELFVGYEGFYLMEEEAVRVLVGTLYSDDEEQVWVAQTHGRTVGEWQDISDNPNRFGFDGLFKKAKAYCWN